MFLSTKKFFLINILIFFAAYSNYKHFKKDTALARQAMSEKVMSMLTLVKKPNIEIIQNFLRAFTMISVIDVWLDQLTFDEKKHTLEFTLKAMTADKLYVYINKLEPLLKTYKWNITDTNVTRKDFKSDAPNKSEEVKAPTPFILNYLKHKMASENTANDSSKSKKFNDKYRYAATVKAVFNEQ